MNRYDKYKSTISTMVNNFPMAFAFSNEQFEKAKEKLGVTSKDELLSTPSGGMIRKIDKQAFTDMHKEMDRLHEEMMKDDIALCQGFIYELGNHEYIITYDPSDTLDCFGLDIEKINNDERLKRIFKKAHDHYMKWQQENY